MAKLLTEEEYNALIADRERLAEVLKQIPEGMEHCTIIFKECEVGHGTLTASNWVQYPCKQCEIEKLKADRERLEWVRDNSAYWDVDKYTGTGALRGPRGMLLTDEWPQVFRDAVDLARGAK